MRVLMVAPFARGRAHGGSQRATAIAERLEERGLEVGWQVVSRRMTTSARKVSAIARGKPGLTCEYEPPERLAAGAWDVALVAHSYLFPRLESVLGDVPTAVDFHN